MLFGGRSHGSPTDSFKTAVIDTIVAEVQSVPGEDRAILLLGYEAPMREMFQVRPHTIAATSIHTVDNIWFPFTSEECQ
jgi:hypothetical protein